MASFCLYTDVKVAWLLFCTVTWCAISEIEEQKCLDLSGNITLRNIRGKLQCVRGQSATDCMQRIKVGKRSGLLSGCNNEMK